MAVVAVVAVVGVQTRLAWGRDRSRRCSACAIGAAGFAACAIGAADVFVCEASQKLVFGF